jgi:DNA-binding NarL/FixJ family response regulator
VPSLKIIVLTVDGDEHVVREAMRLGVNGYVLKSNASAEILAAVDTVTRGQTYLSPEVTTTVANIYRRSMAPAPRALSPRETEVLRLLAAGQSSKQMADALGLSVTTVDSHRHNIMKRLNLSSVAELTKYAIREGLTSLDD